MAAISLSWFNSRAGTTEGSPGSIAAGNRPDDRRQTSAFSANGQDDSNNENMIDGFDNNERIIGTHRRAALY